MQRAGLFSRGKVTEGVCSPCAEKMMHAVRAGLPHVLQEPRDEGQGSRVLTAAFLFCVGIGLTGCGGDPGPTATRQGARDWHLLTIAEFSAEQAGRQPAALLAADELASLEVRP